MMNGKKDLMVVYISENGDVDNHSIHRFYTKVVTAI